MQACVCMLLCCLLGAAALIATMHAAKLLPRQRVERPQWRSSAALWPPRQVQEGEGLKAKLLSLGDQAWMESSIVAPQRGRGFLSNKAPLDGLSVSSMETKQANKQSGKVAVPPRRRLSPPPIDRIGMSRLPSGRG